MFGDDSKLEQYLGNILRGAAKILGCNSTNLILVNEKTGEMRVRLGATAVDYPILAELEKVMGETFRGLSVLLERVHDSLIYQAWKEGVIYESSSLVEILGNALPTEVVEQIEGMIGEHRYILVPLAGAYRPFGVLLLEKGGRQPFTQQQREVLLRYARRVGEIIENDLRGQGHVRLKTVSSERDEYFIVDEEGRLLGSSPNCEQSLSKRLLSEIAKRVGSIEQGIDGLKQIELGDVKLRILPFEVLGRPAGLCILPRNLAPDDAAIESHLLQLTLGEPSPAVFLDPDYVITSSNAAMDKLLGVVGDELIGKPIAEFFRDPSEIIDLLNQQVLYPDNQAQEESTVVLHSDGSISHAKVEVLLLADDKDRVVGFLLLVRPRQDGERWTPEQLLKQEHLATMGEMAAQLAHEIRNPLLAIGATLESILKEDLEPPQREILASVSREISRMDMILRKHLVISNELNISDVYVDQLLEDIRRVLERSGQKSGKQIVIQFEEQVVIEADYDALKHVLFNLILNALEASPAGAEVVCRLEGSEDDVSIFVEDRGPGLSASALDCFVPLFTTKKNGTGLGLPVCQKIAQAHGGLVDLKNRPGGGCQAIVVLPHRRSE